jgi:hypothetical protein
MREVVKGVIYALKPAVSATTIPRLCRSTVNGYLFLGG